MNDSGNGLGCVGAAIILLVVAAFLVGNFKFITGEINDSVDKTTAGFAVVCDIIIATVFIYYSIFQGSNNKYIKNIEKKNMYLKPIKNHIDNNIKLSEKIITNINAALEDEDFINKLLELLEDVSEEQDSIKSYYEQNNKIKYDVIKEKIKTLYNESDIDSYPSTYDGINEYKQKELDNISQNEQLYARLSNAYTDLSEIKAAYNSIYKRQNKERCKEYNKVISRKKTYRVLECIAIIIPIVIYGVLAMQWYNSVESYVHELISKNIAKYSLEEDSYFYKSGLETNFEILRIDYYKHGNMIDVVPQLVLCANNRSVSSDEGSAVLREICNQFSVSLNDVPENICNFGSVYFIANGTIMEPDGSYKFIDRYEEYNLISNTSEIFIPYSYLLILFFIYIIIVILIFATKIRRLEES